MSGFKSISALLFFIIISALQANTHSHGPKKIIQEAIKNGEVKHRLVRFFDQSNNLTKEEIFGKNGTLQKERTFSYDTRGNKTAFAETRYSDGKKVQEFRLRSAEYEYDEEGNITKEYSFNADDEKYLKYEYLYDEDGNKRLQVWYNKDGSVFQRSVYSFSDNKSFIDILGFDEQLIKRITFNKDIHGNTISKITTLPDDTEKERIEYKYNDDNNIVEKITYTNGVQTKSEISTYNESGKLISLRAIESEFHDVETSLSFKYDSLGREIEHLLETKFDSGSKTVMRTRYEY